MKLTVGIRATGEAKNLHAITGDAGLDDMTVTELHSWVSGRMQTVVDTTLDMGKIAAADPATRSVMRSAGLDLASYTKNVEPALDGFVRYLRKLPANRWLSRTTTLTWPFTAGRVTYELFVTHEETVLSDMSDEECSALI